MYSIEKHLSHYLEPLPFAKLIERDPIYIEVAELTGLNLKKDSDVLVFPNEYAVTLRVEPFEVMRGKEGVTLRQVGEQLAARYGGTFRHTTIFEQTAPYWVAVAMTPEQILLLSHDPMVASVGLQAVLVEE